MRAFWTRYLLSYPTALIYMLQETEYRPGRYLAWFHRTVDFRRVMKRRRLTITTKVRLLLALQRVVMLAGLLLVVAMLITGILTTEYWWIVAALGVLLLLPFVLAYGILIPLGIGWLFVQKPLERRIIRRARRVLAEHPGRRIAIAGSFGKTTMKELLGSVISEGMKTAMTPGNMNTPIGISRFAARLHGDEDVLIFELGEEKPGDVRRLARLVRPEIGIITGVNEAHLESFRSLDATVETVFELADFVEPGNLFVNEESELAARHAPKGSISFGRKGSDSWKVSGAETSVTGTTFTMTRGKETIEAETGLVGLHTVGITVAAAAVAARLGVAPQAIENGLRNVLPFEHRMQPRPQHGAWIIDDTYNGNREGVLAGLAFLKASGAKRRVYVTPGLVEQGERTEEVHQQIGEHIAKSADYVVLMNNSVTGYIQSGMKRGKFAGQLMIVDDPLDFYGNLDQFVAAGDIVLMQNDWTDNYQ